MTKYDVGAIKRYVKQVMTAEATGVGRCTMSSITAEERYMNRNGLYWDRRNNVIVANNVPIFRVRPQYGTRKVQGTYMPKLPILEAL